MLHDAAVAQDLHEVLTEDVLHAAHASRALVRKIAPDAVVSAGTWAPVRVAVAIAGDLPLSVDLPGDPFADAQAAAFAEGSAAQVAGVDAAADAATVPACARTQRSALAASRLNTRTACPAPAR